MADLEKFQKNLEARGFCYHYFPTAQAAADYLDGQIDGCSVGVGGSMTVQAMELCPRLERHNRVLWHWTGAELQEAVTTDVYLTSVNGAAENGDLVNIDGTGNRVAATMFGHKRVYFIMGVNKIMDTPEQALWRARNIAAPKNAQRLNRNTPCAVKADKCYDCSSPERICRALTVLWGKPKGIEQAEVIVIGQDLGL